MENMENTKSITRQEFVAGAAVAGAAVALGSSVINVVTARAADDAETKQMGFWVDTANCVDCGTCAHACDRANKTPEDVASRRKILECTTSAGKPVFVSVSCMHCSTPTCMEVCPAAAITKRNDGIVVVDQKRCIGCKYCHEACPFGVPHYTKDGMDKCDYCIGNGRYPEQGPACAEACPHDALHWGDIQDLLAQAGGRAKQMYAITGPSLILS